MIEYKQGKFYYFIAAGFLYATLVVDLYRKIIGVGVDGVRNIIYIFLFFFLFVDMIRSHRIKEMMVIGIVMAILFLISSMINSGYGSIYITSIILFFSRLWPAYYIGRYTMDWEKLSKVIYHFSWIAIIYSVTLMIIPEVSDDSAYATIASNLVFVTLVTWIISIKEKKILGIFVSLFCFIPIFFYGTRVYFFGILLSFCLLIFLRMKGNFTIKKSFLFFIIILSVLLTILYSDQILKLLIGAFPNSRTLLMLNSGDLFDDSNRDSYYLRIIQSLLNNPFKIYGLLGDRIYYASYEEDILSSFSHNCILELCMNFGLLIGGILSVYFLYILVISYKRSIIRKKLVHKIFVALLGVSIINMMLSASYLSEYFLWLLFGLAYNINTKKIVYE